MRHGLGLLLLVTLESACGGARSGTAATPKDGAPMLPGGETPTRASPTHLRHPGILVDKDQLDFVKAKIASGTDPWGSALAAAMASKYGSLSYAPAPLANVACGSHSSPDIGCTDERHDATAAYTHALIWYFTNDRRHAQKAIWIMNGWVAELKRHTDSNAPIQSAWVASVLARAAEIVRWSNAGWSPSDVAQFAAMLKNVYLPEVISGAPKENGNWELSMAEAAIAIGVFLDDPSTFQRGVSMWRARVPAYVYSSSDGPAPVLPPGGAVSPSQLGAFWFGPTQLVDGMAQETCRDVGHVQYGFAAMINAAETARIQGVDLYSEQSTRIVAGLEFHAQYLDGTAVPSWLCGGTLSAPLPAPTWEIAYNEYANRLSLSLPYTHRLLTKIRPTGVDHHMDWETLTHGEIGTVGVP